MSGLLRLCAATYSPVPVAIWFAAASISPKLTCCPTCRGPLGSIRNLAMERVANSVLFPCKYASSGCEITLPHTEKADHEELCVSLGLIPVRCPGASCKWQGSLDVCVHLMHQHKSITTLQGEDIVSLLQTLIFLVLLTG